MPKLNRKNFLRKLLFDKRAVSVAVSTMIITAGVVAMGIGVLYWTYSLGNIANQQYMSNMESGSNAMGERIAFELITYQSSSQNVTVNMINWGRTNNVSVARVYIWGSNHQPIGSYSGDELSLKTIKTNDDIPGNVLNVDDEGYICIHVGSALDSSGPNFTIRIVTERGRNFDGSFATTP